MTGASCCRLDPCSSLLCQVCTHASEQCAEEAVGQCLWGGGMFLKGLGLLLSETLIYVTAVKGL